MKQGQHLNALKLGLAGGIVWGVLLFIMTLIANETGYGMYWLSQWMDLYYGYDLSFIGAFLGLIYGFVNGFIDLFLLGWIYNRLKP